MLRSWRWQPGSALWSREVVFTKFSLGGLYHIWLCINTCLAATTTVGFKTSQESSQLKAEVLRYLGVVRLRVRWGRAPFSSSHLGEKYIGFYKTFPVAQTVQNLPTMQETWVPSLVRKIPWRREWLPALIFSPRNSIHRGARLATVHRCCRESDMTEQPSLTYILMLRSILRGVLKSLGSFLKNHLLWFFPPMLCWRVGRDDREMWHLNLQSVEAVGSCHSVVMSIVQAGLLPYVLCTQWKDVA